MKAALTLFWMKKQARNPRSYNKRCRRVRVAGVWAGAACITERKRKCL